MINIKPVRLVAPTNKFQHVYSIADISATFNFDIFKAEIANNAGSFSVVPAISLETSTAGVFLVATWTVKPSDADVSAYDAIAAAHTGGTLQNAVRTISQSPDPLDATSSTPVNVFDVTANFVPEGDYIVLASANISMPATAASTFADMRFFVNGSLVLATTLPQSMFSQPSINFGFSAHRAQSLRAGASLHAQLQIAKLGASAATVRSTGGLLSIIKTD